MEHRPDLIQEADVISGTSTGGIIALMLAAGYDTDHTLKLYTEEGPALFRRRWWHFFGLFGAKYHNTGLQQAMQRELGEFTLRDLNKLVLIPSIDLAGRRGTYQTVKGTFFHNFEGSDYLDVPSWEVGMYTSAAPTFFKPFRSFVDGGMIANNPCMAAVAQVLSKDTLPTTGAEDIRCLSIGTGFPTKNYSRLKDFGLTGAATLVDIIFQGLEASPSFLARSVLNGNFHRINPVDEQNLAMDDIKNIQGHLSLADRCDLDNSKTWLDEVWT
jgi:patatin-like phospholipase/acyl hydrolase